MNSVDMLKEIEECAENVRNAGRLFDINLDIVNGVEFFEVSSIENTYNKFKKLNEFTAQYYEDVMNYVNSTKSKIEESVQ